MPYRLRKAPRRDLYWVVGEDGSKSSRDPLPLETAKAQMAALYAAMPSTEGGSAQSGFVRRMLGEVKTEEYTAEEIERIRAYHIPAQVLHHEQPGRV